MDKHPGMSNRILALAFVLILGVFSVANIDRLLDDDTAKAESKAKDVASALGDFESRYNDNVFLKTLFLDVNGLFRNILGQRTLNGVVKLDNGYLTQTVERRDVRPYADRLAALNSRLESAGIPLLYVQSPHKICKYDDQLPAGVTDHGNQNADDLLHALDGAGVETLDLRAEMLSGGLDHYSLFFRADHHWTVEGSFWGFTRVMDALDKKFGIQTDDKYTDISNYDVKVYEDWFLGSWGQKTGLAYAGGADDISLITPKFPTDLTLTISSKNIVREGSFADAIFVMERLEPKDYYHNPCFEVYLGGQYPLITIKNNIAQNDKKVLLVLDSFARPVGSFMSSCFKEVDIIDLRKYTENNLEEYILKSRPDAVMFFYNPDALYDTFFDF